MEVIRAEAMGLCFGVRDALAVARTLPHPGGVTIHGELVHNELVLVELNQLGYHFTPEGDRSGLPDTGEVLITAHGVSERERRRLETAGKRLIDTTCPLVRRVHEAAGRLAAAGYHVLVAGRPEHVEVRGIVEDLTDFDVITSADDVKTWPHPRLGLVCQTTTPPRLAGEVHAAVRARNPQAEVRFVDTICQPTRERQQAVERLCRQVDAVVVVGGANSNNTRRLAELCREQGVPAYQVQSAADVDPAWLQGCRKVGLTAGTSTLDQTVQEVHDRLAALPESASAA